jgi:hypothetical protein|tara:strand:+ start:279 stop:500 length:222 start_codon:yes stop_codon:yes gene_type:complete
MEYQMMFNLAIVAVSFFGGWMVNRVFTLIDRLDKDMKVIPEKYIAKDDYREDIREIKDLLGAIFKRLEGKADK